LIGLLFVAVSLHLDVFSDSRDVQYIAEQTLTTYLYILVLSLLLNVPDQKPLVIGGSLAGAGLIGILLTLYNSYRVHKAGYYQKFIRRGFLRYWLWRVGAPAFGYAWLAMTGVILIGTGTTDPLYWLVWIVAGMLVSATRNSWSMMILLARFKKKR